MTTPLDLRPQSSAEAPSPAGPRAPAVERASVLLVTTFWLAHIPLALMMRAIPVTAAVHEIACVLGGIVIAATRPTRQVAMVVGYIVGSEVLWRMSGGGLFWEFGKYGVSAVLVVALLRTRVRRNRALMFGYLFLLIPSSLLTLAGSDLDKARQLISFNLSGPLSLTLCVLFFSNVRLSSLDIRRSFYAAIGPVLGMAALSALSIAGSDQLEFVNASNFVASGGFGPNQVSAMLGLGLMLAVLLVFERRSPFVLRLVLLGFSVVFAVESALTFSRGGLALAFAGVAAAALYLVRDRRTRITLLVITSLLFVVGQEVVIPRLETFTKGKLVERYTSANPSGRGNLANDDLEIFEDRPLMGVGPGMATALRQERGHLGAAHTEYTRMLAEHGVLGALAILMILLMCIRVVKRAKSSNDRAFVVAFVVWFLLFLAIDAMRIVAASFVLGLAFAVAYSAAPQPRGSKLAGTR